MLRFVDRPPNLVLVLAQTLLQTAEQLFFLAFGKSEVVIRQLGILLLQFALNFVPVAFDLELCHNRYFAGEGACGRTSRIRSAFLEDDSKKSSRRNRIFRQKLLS